MDEAPMRRGVESANARWNNTVAILTGDYLFAKTSAMLADLGPGAARAYKGGSLNDWYLPTLGELNNLGKWSRGLPWKSESTIIRGGSMNNPIFGAGSVGLVGAPYWSSNEGIRQTVDKVHHVVGNPKYASSFAYALVITAEENIRIAPDVVSPFEKIGPSYVRPIRAF